MKYTGFGRSSRRRRGAVLVLTVVTLVVIMGFAALTVDVGRLYNTRVELQNSADAAALGAAQDLGGIDPYASMEAARATALDLVSRNPVWNSQPVSRTSVTFGSAQLNEAGTDIVFVPGVVPANAIRVAVEYDLEFTFAQIFGLTSTTVSASATAGIGARDFVIVLDCSGSMTKQSVEAQVAADLTALGITYSAGQAIKKALALTYNGADPEFAGVYAIGAKFLPPTVRIQPLKATKDAAAFAVDVIRDAGYDDLLGAVAYATLVEWVEPLTTNYSRVKAKVRGITKYGGTSLHEGIRAARVELLSSRAREGTEKVIVLMTDGKSDPARALSEAQLAVDAEMKIHCIGLGDATAVDHALLDEIAALGGGVALYVENTTDVSVYGPQLKAVFQSIAQNEVGIGLIQ